uniref:Large ribosomal subunit protein uL24m n=1 Tax=Lynceus sp. MCZ IZ 141354 TaxID=1930659 RepID=A0A9N6ZHA6_9CRUS|nr:EOG090X0ADH [Lynceus sp. MCZ IZ 141354]
MRLTNFLRNVGEWSKKYANLPDSYIKRAMEKTHWKSPRGLPQYLPKDIKKKNYRYTMNRPWTEEFLQENNRPRKKVFVEPIKDWSFFRGDKVEILVGKDKGKVGIVNYIVQERNWVCVEGLNVHFKTIGQMDDYPGVMTTNENPLLVTSQVSLIDPSDNKPTKVEWRFTEQGDRVRVSVRTGRILPIPPAAFETVDYKVKAGYPEQEKDSISTNVTQVTFEPKLKTFEMDLMEAYGLAK